MLQKVYFNTENTATITCSECNKSRILNVERYLQARRPINVKCGCGNRFPIQLEGRKYYRKEADLTGTYTHLDSSKAGRMIVETLSFSGVGFRTLAPHVIQVGDVLRVEFRLDNVKRTHINKWVIVRWVHQQRVGSEFEDAQPYDKDMTIYLMPS